MNRRLLNISEPENRRFFDRKYRNCTYSKKYTYTDIYSQSLNTHLLDVLLPIGCEKFPCVVHGYLNFQRTVNFSLFQTFQNQRTAVPSYSKSLEEPAVLRKELVTNKSWFSWLVMRFFSISENHGYIPTPDLWFLRPAVVTPNNLSDNRKGGLFLPLITHPMQQVLHKCENGKHCGIFHCISIEIFIWSHFFEAVLIYFLDIRCALQLPW